MSSHPFPPGSSLVAYLRDSGHDDQELSIPQQEKELRKWALENDLTLTRLYRDSATASTTTGRDQFNQMMSELRQGMDVAGLVVWKFSRFARNLDDAQFYKADLRRRGYEIHSLKDNLPPGPEGRFFEAALDWMNQRHLEDMSIDIQRALRNNVQTYGAIPGTPPAGFKRTPLTLAHHRDGKPRPAHRWDPDPALTPRIRLAFELKLAGATAQEILRQTRLFTSITSLKTFYTNQLYIGTLIYGDLTLENYCDPIIDPQLFTAVQELIQSQAGGNTTSTLHHPRRKAAPPEYLLTGLLYCPRCGAPLNTNHTRKGGKIVWTAYTCGNVKRNRTCDAPSLPRQPLEDAVLQTIQTYILDPDLLTALQTTATQRTATFQADTQTHLTTTRTELAENRRQLTNLTNAIKVNGHSPTLLKSLSELEKQQETILQTLATLETDLTQIPPTLTPARLTETTARLKKQLDSGNHLLIRQTLQGLIHKITAEREGNHLYGQILYYHPAQKKTLHPVV